ncbi:MAG: hypothetical protein ACRDOO_28230, partial [Actinomadura sp.]
DGYAVPETVQEHVPALVPIEVELADAQVTVGVRRPTVSHLRDEQATVDVVEGEGLHDRLVMQPLVAEQVV